MAGAGASAALPESIQKALAIEPNIVTGTIQDVQHIVILMQENRSFDHYFGTLRGVRGFQDPRAVRLYGTGNSVFEQPNQNSAGVTQNPPTIWPFRPVANDLGLAFLADLPHAWRDAHQCWNNGRYDQWPRAKNSRNTMAYLKRSDIPYYYALADAFTVCDAYFTSAMLSTDPNRYYHWTGWCGQNGTTPGRPQYRKHAGNSRSRQQHRQRRAAARARHHQRGSRLQLEDVSRAAARSRRHLEDLPGQGHGPRCRRRMGMGRRATVHRQLRLQFAAVFPAIPKCRTGFAVVRGLADRHPDLQQRMALTTTERCSISCAADVHQQHAAAGLVDPRARGLLRASELSGELRRLVRLERPVRAHGQPRRVREHRLHHLSTTRTTGSSITSSRRRRR